MQREPYASEYQSGSRTETKSIVKNAKAWLILSLGIEINQTLYPRVAVESAGMSSSGDYLLIQLDS